jgi:putative membrane protein
MMLIGLIAIVLVVYLLLNKDNGVKSQRKTALAILDERYARGDITEEEYLEKKRILGDSQTD